MVEDLVKLLIPHIILLLAIFFQVIFGLIKSPMLVFKYKNVNIYTSNAISMFAFALSLISIFFIPVDYSGFSSSLKMQPFVKHFYFLILASGLSTVMLDGHLLKDNRQSCYKFHILLLTTILGALFTVLAQDFLTLFVALETVSFGLYFLIAFSKGYKSKEAAFKYLVFNSISVAFFLFGVSYLLGMSGALNYQDITEAFNVGRTNGIMYSVAVLFLFIGLVMKLAIFPFANWILDVYTGAESAILNLLSTVPKVAVLGVLIKLYTTIFSYSFELYVVMLLLSLLTALWANVYAINECNFKRIMACSSAANSAYLLVLFTIAASQSYGAGVFYLFTYVFMNIAIFAYLNLVEPVAKSYDVLKMPKVKNVFLNFCFAVAVLGLAGLPITSGFVAKIYLLYALVSSGLVFLPLVIMLLFLFAIALFYYIKLLKVVLNPIGQPIFSRNTLVLLVVSGLITLFLGFLPFALIVRCENLFS